MKEYFSAGAVVLATAGREKGEIFIILNEDNEYAFLINGDTRTIENPKKKNKKHLHLLCKSEKVELDISNADNALVKKFLNNYNKSRVK
ncbi:MAG: RNA-binding protein [Clostridia bacterium]|nr:RNA-binding protein [Clostridia bacterium]